MPQENIGRDFSNRTTINIFMSLSILILSISVIQLSTGQALSIHDDGSNIYESEYDEYSPYNNYTTVPTFNSASMRIIYEITDSMVNSLIHDIIPTDLLEIDNNEVYIKDGDYLGLVRHYMGYIIFISVLLLFSLLMPIIGLCFCCCRCCGNCGADAEPFDRRGDHWKKITFGAMLLTLAIFFLFGMVGTFGTNEQLQEGTENLVENLKISISDTSLYFTDVSNHIQHLSNKNLLIFSDTLIETVGNTSAMLYTQLEELTKVNYIYDAFDLAEKLEPIKENLTMLERETKQLRVQALQIDGATRDIQRRLKEECGLPCNTIADELVTNIDLNQIPDVKDVIDKIDDIDENISNSIETGKTELDKVQEDMKAAIDANVNEAQQTIVDTTNEVKSESEKFLSLISDMNSNITEISNDGMDAAKRYIEDYSIYRYYLGLVVSCIFLLIVVCIFIGIIVGVCADRPDRNTNSHCDKSIGNGFLMFGVGVMFCTSTVLVIILIVHNLAMILQLLVCDPIRNPNTSSVIQLLDDVANLEEIMWPGITIKSVITNCNDNDSVYNVFNIQEKFNVSELNKYIDNLDTDEIINKIHEELKESHIFDDLSNKLNIDDSITQLNKLKETGVGEINLDFEVDFGEINLESISTKLDDIINRVPEEVAEKLKKIKLRIDAYIKYLLDPMKISAKNVMEYAKNIIDTMDSEEGFNGALDDLIENLTEMQEHLETFDEDQIIDIIEPVFNNVLNQTKGFVNFVMDNVETKLGKCAPLASTINGVLIATCDNILVPMNGFWFSIFWCLIFYIPMIIISVKLGSLFKKIEPISDKYYESYTVPQNKNDYQTPRNVIQANMLQNNGISRREMWDYD